ncbi:MAG TPA: AAA family ATPase [Burkholderiales bacterium]|nr:AAA family ATPase [Burkholderiales bacterium]
MPARPCAACGHVVADGANYCERCGARVPAACPACGAELASSTARYCSSCGEKLGPQDETSASVHSAAKPLAPERRAAERRQTTVLMCDLVDSTALSADLDPEEVLVVLQGFLDTATAIVHKHRGFIARYMGDGLLVYFGYPRADEHSTELAVRAGLELVKAIHALRPLPEITLQARVGIATGIVVVGDLIGTGSSREAPAMGVTPNLATRLQSVARPGTVYLCRETYALVGRLFDCSYVGAQRLKGFRSPVNVWEAVGTRTVESRFEALHPLASATQLVDREKELARLMPLWERARKGKGQFAFVIGDPGIGKSKLVSTLLEHIAADNVVALRMQGAPNYENSAFFPIIDLLRRMLAYSSAEAQQAPDANVQVFLAERYGRSAAEAELIRDLLSPAAEEGLALPNPTSERRKESTIQALLGLMGAVAARKPRVLLVEDAQWADPSTIEVLARLVQRLHRLPVLLLVTCRPGFETTRIARKPARRLVLDRLGKGDSAALIRNLSGGKPLPADLMELILTRTDGVPLFVEELAKSMLESSTLKESGDRYEYSSSRARDPVPTTLRDSLMARLDRLPAAKVIAQTAATIGREFGYELLSAVAAVPARQLDEALASLTESELIFPATAGPSRRYLFKHALVQEIARDSLLGSRRQTLHRRIAELLETRFAEPANNQPEILAHHYTEAGDYRRGAEFWRSAGLSAVRRFANHEAASHLRRALHVLSLCPETAERNAQELELLAILGQVLIAASGYASPGVEDSFRHARKLFAVTSNNAHKALVLRTQCLFLVTRARYAEAHGPARELAQLGVESAERRAQADADFVEGLAHLYQGNFTQARSHLEHAVAILGSPEDGDLSVSCLAFLGRTLAFLGQLDLALAQCSRSLNLARHLSDQRALPQASGMLVLVSQARGDLPATQRWTKRTLRHSKEKGTMYWLRVAEFFDNWLRAYVDGRPGALTGIANSIASYEATGARVGLSFFLVLQAEAQQRVGQYDDALTVLDLALNHVEQTGEAYYAAEVHRRQGELTLARWGAAQAQAAEASFLRAIEIARLQQARTWELRAATSLARLWLAQGRDPAAYRLLSAVHAAFCEGADTTDLREAAALLAELSARGAGSEIAGVGDEKDQRLGSA